MAGISTRLSLTAFVTSVFLAMVLSVASFPVEWLSWRPEWLAMVVCYWMIRSPAQVGILTAAICGLLLDVLEGSLLGQNALAFATMAMLVLGSHQRFRVLMPLQQGILLFFILGIVQMMIHVIKALTGAAMPGFYHLLSAMTSAVVWPFLVVLLDNLSVRLR